jgi:uncharacterized protein (TIGR02246 family)
MIFPRRARWILSCAALVLVAAVTLPTARAVSAEATALPPSGTVSAQAKAPPLPAKPASAESEIRATAVAFVKAFNRGDARAVAALWTADGSAADDSGTIYKGRPAIEGQYAELFKQHPGARMEVAVKSIELPTPTTAIEDGIARVEAERAGPPQISRYTAVHVKQDGKWLMASVRETSIELPSNFARVEGLGWLVGTWKAERDGAAVHTTIRWIANKSFLEREYTVRKDGIAVSSGKQIIGWDPKAGQIRSWSFDATGGQGTGLWTATPEGWRIESSGVLPDGTSTSSRELLIRVPGEDNVLGWRSVARNVGGASLPDTPEVVLDRILEKK